MPSSRRLSLSQNARCRFSSRRRWPATLKRPCKKVAPVNLHNFAYLLLCFGDQTVLSLFFPPATVFFKSCATQEKRQEIKTQRGSTLMSTSTLSSSAPLCGCIISKWIDLGACVEERIYHFSPFMVIYESIKCGSCSHACLFRRTLALMCVRRRL